MALQLLKSWKASAMAAHILHHVMHMHWPTTKLMWPIKRLDSTKTLPCQPLAEQQRPAGSAPCAASLRPLSGTCSAAPAWLECASGCLLSSGSVSNMNCLKPSWIESMLAREYINQQDMTASGYAAAWLGCASCCLLFFESVGTSTKQRQ